MQFYVECPTKKNGKKGKRKRENVLKENVLRKNECKGMNDKENDKEIRVKV